MAAQINIKSDGDVSAKKKDLSMHTKKTVLEFLKENGCTCDNLETVARARRHDTQKIIDFICQSYENAEQAVNQDCDSVSFNNINQWLELVKNSDLSTICQYEAAAVLNAIRHNEPQSEPEQLGGINMRQAYTFLENALTGQPQKKLDEATEAFVSREIEVSKLINLNWIYVIITANLQLLIADANTEQSDNLARIMRQCLFDRQEYDYEAEPHRCSLDPLFLSDE
ncbi:hypothetical protein KR093_001764 [Drosophila rubida]|uniref:Uncharacterized protein n=1 Tax=Drosophila rubida TaxID=30044 RepID=A0AAD4PK05_9MUSC|nr:hypothetical protein KR093_001764 [Drosophila rubida]